MGGLQDSGALGRLMLWQHPARQPEDQGALVRAPGAVFLEIDSDFQTCLQKVHAVIRRVAPASGQVLAWDVQPMARSGEAPERLILRYMGGT